MSRDCHPTSIIRNTREPRSRVANYAPCYAQGNDKGKEALAYRPWGELLIVSITSESLAFIRIAALNPICYDWIQEWISYFEVSLGHRGESRDMWCPN